MRSPRSALLAALLAAALAGALARPGPSRSPRAPTPADRTEAWPDPGNCDAKLEDQAHQLCCYIKMRNAEITGRPQAWREASCDVDLRLYGGRPCNKAVAPAAFRLCCTDKRARATYAKTGYAVDPSCPVPS